MFVIQIIDVYGENLCLLMPSVFWNIGGLAEFGEYWIMEKNKLYDND